MRVDAAAALAAALAWSPAAWSAVPPPVLGVTVGAPLNLPKCEFSASAVPAATCWAPEPYDPPGQEIARSVFLGPEDESRASFVTNTTIILDAEGRVAGLVLLTSGISSQEDALRALEAKFGKPSAYHVDRLQNRMGAKFNGVRARWRAFGLVVDFDSTAGGDLDSGEIDILTPAEAAARAAKDTPPSL